MSLLSKVEKVYSKELDEYCNKYPTLGIMLLDELSSKQYVGEMTISRMIDFSCVIGKSLGETIDTLYKISTTN